MLARLTFLFTAMLLAADSAFDEAALLKLIETNQVKTIDQLLPLLPEEMRSRWLPSYGSNSAQNGTRILLVAPGGRMTLGFNLDPKVKGYEHLEVKSFDEATETYRFTEFTFEKDLRATPPQRQGADQKALALPFKGGVHVNPNALNQETLGGSNCKSCHPGGDSRFDRREMAAFLHFDPKRFGATKPTLDDPRMKALVLSEAEKEALRTGDLDSLDAAMDKRAEQVAEELMGQDARALARKMENFVANRPELALSVLAALKGCGLEDLMTTGAWRTKVKGWATRDHAVSDEWKREMSQYLSTSPETESIAKVLGMLEKRVRDSIIQESKQLAKRAGPRALPDPVPDESEVRILAQMDFLIDLLGRNHVDARTDLTVENWGPTSHFRGYWFNGRFDLYKQAMIDRLEGFLQKKFGTTAAFSCEKLKGLSLMAYQAMEKQGGGSGAGTEGH